MEIVEDEYEPMSVFNDLSMIKYAGLGVAMANAKDSVKEAADYITTSCDEDGIAKIIYKFMLDK